MAKRLTDQEHHYRSWSESMVINVVLDYLRLRGAHCWRNNTGSVVAEHQGKKRFIRFSEVGAADVFCILDGRFIAIETKTETGKQSDEQRDWQQQIEAAGGVYLVARPSTWQQVIDDAVVLAERRQEEAE